MYKQKNHKILYFLILLVIVSFVSLAYLERISNANQKYKTKHPQINTKDNKVKIKGKNNNTPKGIFETKFPTKLSPATGLSVK